MIGHEGFLQYLRSVHSLRVAARQSLPARLPRYVEDQLKKKGEQIEMARLALMQGLVVDANRANGELT